MNERIRELAKEARLLTGWPVGEVEYQEFAELIVRECTERLLNDVKLTDIRTTRCVASIKEHFGVER